MNDLTKSDLIPRDPTPAEWAQLAAQVPPRVTPQPPQVEYTPAKLSYPATIATALTEIMGEIGGVAKKGRNEFHKYNYQRIEDILVAVTPLLAKHGILIVQSEVGRALFDNDSVVSVSYAFTIIYKNGDVWPERPVQTGMSAARNSKGGFDDKSFNKCHTAARKYFLKSLLQITDQETSDADSQEDQPSSDELIKGDLIKRINATESLETLEALIKDEDVKASYGSLEAEGKAQVTQAVQTRKAALGAKAA